MLITCVLVSHEKADYCRDAVRSVLAQTHADWRLVILDSGKLLSAGYFAGFTDPRVSAAANGETPAMRRTHCLQGWSCNEAFRRGLVAPGLVCFLPDDDLYDPGVFAAWVEAASDASQSAWYGAVDVEEDGAKIGELPAGETWTATNLPACRIDGMQACCRVEVCPEWPEGRRDRRRCDAVWLDRLAERTPIHPVAARCGSHRRTAASYNTPAGGLRVELGGGRNPREGFINVDALDVTEVDEVVDLSRDRLPFADGSVGVLYSSHCLEHVEPYGLLLREIARVCRAGAAVEIRVPHWLSDMAHCAGHRHAVSPTQVRHWCKDFIADWWAGGKKRLDLLRTEQIPSASFADARAAFPHLTDEQVMRFIPDACHESRYHFTVVTYEG